MIVMEMCQQKQRNIRRIDVDLHQLACCTVSTIKENVTTGRCRDQDRGVTAVWIGKRCSASQHDYSHSPLHRVVPAVADPARLHLSVADAVARFLTRRAQPQDDTSSVCRRRMTVLSKTGIIGDDLSWSIRNAWIPRGAESRGAVKLSETPTLKFSFLPRSIEISSRLPPVVRQDSIGPDSPGSRARSPDPARTERRIGGVSPTRFAHPVRAA